MILTIKQIVSQLTYKYKNGQSLKSIYDGVKSAFVVDGAWYFLEFVIQHRNDEVFMTEFNSTSFAENANPNLN